MLTIEMKEVYVIVTDDGEELEEFECYSDAYNALEAYKESEDVKESVRNERW